MPLKMFDNKAHLFQLLSYNTTALTPNNRLADLILQNYFTHCGHPTVDKPTCIPYRVALSKAYEQLNFHNPNLSRPTLLNNAQCQHLWRRIIKSTGNITYSEGLLKSVISAWERCQQWQIQPEDSNFDYSAQTQQFQRWWLLFEEQLNHLNAITEHQVIPYLLDSNTGLFSKPLVWICFDEFTPQQVRLQNHLANKSIEQYQYDLQEKSSEVRMLAAKDNQNEYQQLINWLQLQIQESKQRIGVVMPNLEQESHALHRVLAKHFQPELFNLTLGNSLSNYPLVANALCWLNLENTFLTPHQAYQLLQSPYLSGSKEEFIARSEYLQESTLLEQSVISLPRFLEELRAKSPKLATALSNLAPYPQQSSINEWIHAFIERLNRLGFPGDYGLTSKNYQCFNRFIGLFDELRQFALFHPQLTQKEALDALHHLANNTIFQAQKTHAPIQVSGLLEASGCEFDSLWVMGLTDQCLPQKIQLSAFIPPQMQRELCMPHSLPERELQFAKKTLHRLQQGADSVVFSYAELQGDIPNLPCSLITKFPPFVLTPISAHELNPTSKLLFLDEDFNLPVLPEEPISGGSAILSHQAQCPFKAFATHRLRAKSCSQITDGLDNRERGQIIHKVMELLWQQLESQQKLLGMTSEHLDCSIKESVSTALSSLKEKYASFPELVQEVEQQRLTQLVHSCLEWEKQRPPFTVAALEQSYSINLAGLNMSVRVDRLDHVEENKWIIDYKSTLPTSKPWNEERPREPQLLLYALLDEHINTLLLLQLKAGKIYSSGLSEEKLTLQGVASLKKDETWNEFRAKWKQQLTDLAIEFQQGHCLPQPTPLTTCQHCEFQSLCRFQKQ